MIGEVVGSYRITEKIATGGMGVVYKAEHALIGKTAAVKVLRREYSEDRGIMERFFREAQATTAIRHPGIVDIYDFGYYQNERAYIIMEYLGGDTLKEHLRVRGMLAADAAIRLIRSVASAVGAAHEQGVIHRDLKPDNILLVPDADMPDGQRIKVLDFGLAKLTDAQSATTGTQAGLVLGTPAYMAPEQCSGQGQIDIRADIYALGCILFQLVCGRPPFEPGGGFARILMAHMQVPPPLPRSINGAIPESLERIILKLLAKSPDARFQTMVALRQALDACAQEMSEIPVAVLVESTDASAMNPAHAHDSGPGSGSSRGESSHISTLGASTGQVMTSRSQASSVPGRSMHSSAMRALSAHDSSVHGGSVHSDSSRRMATHGSGMRQGGSVHESVSRPRRRLAMLPWVLGAAASILLGLGLVLILGSGSGSGSGSGHAVVDTHGLEDGPPAGLATENGSVTDEPGVESNPTATGEPDAGTASTTANETVRVEEIGEEEVVPIVMEPDEMIPEVVEPVKVRLSIEPATATVVVDGEVRTENPLELEPRDKAYRIDVQAKGFESERRWVRADKDRRLKVELQSKGLDLDL